MGDLPHADRMAAALGRLPCTRSKEQGCCGASRGRGTNYSPPEKCFGKGRKGGEKKKEEEEETIEKLLTEPFHFILYYNRSKANNG